MVLFSAALTERLLSLPELLVAIVETDMGTDMAVEEENVVETEVVGEGGTARKGSGVLERGIMLGATGVSGRSGI